MKHTALATMVLPVLATLACGSSPSGADAPGRDAGTADAIVADGAHDAQVHDATPIEAAADGGTLDHGSPSGTYPAFTPDVGQITYNGGHVMKHPVIVAITWDGDPSQAIFDAYADAIGGTAYWSATTLEYGVSAATSGASNHAHISTTAPASLQDSDLQGLVKNNAGITAGWPAATEDTIYAFFLPPGLSLLEPSFTTGQLQDSCAQHLGGYHDQLTVGSVTSSYAVVPSCNFGKGNTPEQWTTQSMSHELIEAVTDPQPQGAQSGYTGFDADHFAWDYFQELQSEVGDACEFYRASFFEDKETTPAPFDAWVQRTWSNEAIKAAHDPCVPAASSAPYFSVTPLALETVSYSVPATLTGLPSATMGKTRGILAPSGKSATFAVGFYSDGPTGGPWTISVTAGNPAISASASFISFYNPSKLTASVDRTTGQNGEKAYVTVNVTESGSGFGGEIVTITSTLGGVSHYTPVWIAAK